jgi:hypothetical protein
MHGHAQVRRFHGGWQLRIRRRDQAYGQCREDLVLFHGIPSKNPGGETLADETPQVAPARGLA